MLMKIFLVDVQNSIDMAHYETFFFRYIKEDSISICDKEIDSLEEIDKVRTWLNEEINRNPFSVSKSLVVFFIPRNLSAQRTPQDFECYAKMYIHHLVARHLDQRFEYVCFFVDQTRQQKSDDNAYQEIEKVNKNFSSNDMLLRNSFLPSFLPESEDPKQLIKAMIDALPDEVAADFYRSVLDQIRRTELHVTNQAIDNEAWYTSVFLQSCNETISHIRQFRVSFFSGDISQKIDVVLKLVSYICSFVDHFDAEQEADPQISAFLNRRAFEEYKADMAVICRQIAAYKRRLLRWKPEPYYKDDETIQAFSFEGVDHSAEFEEKVKRVSSDDLRAALNPSMKDLKDYDVSDRVFASLDHLLQDVGKLLKAFCKERIADVRSFWHSCDPTVTEPAENSALTEEEQDAERQLADKLNRYLINDLPGYPAELQLRQELEIRGRMIRKIGVNLKAMKIIAFILTLLFAVTAIGGYYYNVQFSVFEKEETWFVFGIYLLVFAVLFLSSFVAVRIYYKRQVRKQLKECMALIRTFLNNYVSRAREFEQNLNAAIRFFCGSDLHNKQTIARMDRSDYEKRVLWHRLKIKKILENLEFFDAFVEGVEAEDDSVIPPLRLGDDAIHNEFYLMPSFT